MSKECTCSGTGKLYVVKPAVSGYVTTVLACHCATGEKLLEKKLAGS